MVGHKGNTNLENRGSLDISILEQIYTRFGSLLGSSEKFDSAPLGEIHLTQIGGEKETEIKEGTESPSQGKNRGPSTPQNISEEISFTFQKYLNTIKKLQIFQTSNDTKGYREWAQRRGEEGIRLFIALRKWGRQRKEGGLNPASASSPQNKYEELAQSEENIHPEQVKKLEQRIRCFDDMQVLLGRFKQVLRNQPKDLVQGVQLIWPDFKAVLDSEWSSELMLSRIEVFILKIEDVNIQAKIKNLLGALCKQAEAISSKYVEKIA